MTWQVRAGELGRGIAAGLLAIGLAVTASGCFSSEGSSEERAALCPDSAAATRGAGAAPAGLALLGENHLVRISLRRGRVEAERRLPSGGLTETGTGAPLVRLPGQLLVQPRNSGPVAVLTRRAPAGRDEVMAVDPVTLETRCRYSLERGVLYRGIAVGSSGRIYAYGYREGGDEKKAAAVLTTLEPGRRPRLMSMTVRPADSDWWPYWGTVSSDERHVVLSYHGSTSGADFLDAVGDRFRRSPCARRGFLCVGEVHGAIEPYGAGFLAADGQGLIEVRLNGRVDVLPVKPGDVHLMDFVLDAPRGLAYVSSCGNRPEIQRLDLAKMRVTEVPSGHFCGMPLAVYDDRFLIIGASRVNAPDVTEPPTGPLRVLDLRHPGPGIPVRLSGTPQDAIAIGTDG